MCRITASMHLTPKKKGVFEDNGVWWYYRGTSQDFTLTVKSRKKLKSGKYVVTGVLQHLSYSVVLKAEAVCLFYETLNCIEVSGEVKKVEYDFNNFRDRIVLFDGENDWIIYWKGSPVTECSLISVKGRFFKKGKDYWIAGREIAVLEDVEWMSEKCLKNLIG